MFIVTWQKCFLVAVLTMKYAFEQVLQVILRVEVVKLATLYQREDERRVDVLPLLARSLMADFPFHAIHELDGLKAAAEFLVEETFYVIGQIRFPCP